MRATAIAFVMFLFMASSATGAPERNPRLDPIAWVVGLWICEGEYLDVPGFSVAHSDVARFSVAADVGGEWLVGRYAEQLSDGNPVPTAILDSISIDATGTGVRSFVDSHTGRMTSTFTFGDTIEFTGTYAILGFQVGFSETLTRGYLDRSFTTDSRLDLGSGPVTFHRQICQRRS